jgi:hypothetical protein
LGGSSRSAIPAALVALLGASLLLRGYLGFRFFGFVTGDDVEILEAGFRRALGLEYEPWAIRNTLVSDLFVFPAVAAASWFGVVAARSLCWVATWPFVLLSTLNVYLLYRLVDHWLGDRGAALAGAALYAFHWIALGYGSTVYPRTAAAACVLGCALCLAPRNGPREGAPVAWASLAGLLLAVAFAFRYSEVIYLVGAAAGVAASIEFPRALRVRSVLALLLGFTAGCLVFVGLYDAVVWGRPFSSLVAFADFTVVEKNSSSLVKEQSPFWYFWRLPHWISPALLPFLVVGSKGKLPRLAASLVVVPLVLLSIVHHKDLRYLQGILPFVAAATGTGLVFVWRSGWRKTCAIALALSLVWTVAHLRFLQKKSMAAVLAAEALATESSVHEVALQQAWAYGDHLFLPQNTVVHDLPFSLLAGDLEKLPATVDRVALYEEDLAGRGDVSDLLRARPLCPRARFAWGRSRPVVLFGQCPAELEPGASIY